MNKLTIIILFFTLSITAQDNWHYVLGSTTSVASYPAAREYGKGNNTVKSTLISFGFQNAVGLAVESSTGNVFDFNDIIKNNIGWLVTTALIEVYFRYLKPLSNSNERRLNRKFKRMDKRRAKFISVELQKVIKL